jgi:DNA-directed RNA polymerase subunit RPC12/RpoP
MANKRLPNKKCSSCKELKYLKDFSKSKSRPDGRHVQCRVCRSKYKPSSKSKERQKKYLAAWNRYKISGFTQEEYDEKLKQQEYKCAICGTSDSGPMAFHADHDHKTGQKRGVLCHKCNTGLGLLKDSIEVLCSAIEYLNHYSK